MANINSKTFGYCRVSSTDQKEDRQLEAMLELGINERDMGSKIVALSFLILVH